MVGAEGLARALPIVQSIGPPGHDRRSSHFLPFYSLEIIELF
jgi:hypothetical protein